MKELAKLLRVKGVILLNSWEDYFYQNRPDQTETGTVFPVRIYRTSWQQVKFLD